jgi:AcrR family transcriptional regulator
VTLAEIAEAAGVSVKTIFNYFGGKEELFFDRSDELLSGMLEALRSRAPGVSPTAAMRPLLLEGPIPCADGCRWPDLEGGLYESMRGFIVCERASPALSARRLVIAQSWVEPLARESGSEAWAAMCVGVMNLRAQVLGTALTERRTPRTVERRVRATVGEALDALERGFAPTA